MYKIWLLRAKHKSTFILQYTNSYSLYAKETNISHYAIFSKCNILLLYVSFINDNNYNMFFMQYELLFTMYKKKWHFVMEYRNFKESSI